MVRFCAAVCGSLQHSTDLLGLKGRGEEGEMEGREKVVGDPNVIDGLAPLVHFSELLVSLDGCVSKCY